MKVAVIREELIALTNKWQTALVLSQLLFRLKQTKDFALYIEEVKSVLGQDSLPDTDKLDLAHGWIYKSASQLSDEIMLGWSPSTTLRFLSELVDADLLERRRNPKIGWDRTWQYRPNVAVIQSRLFELGYVLDGFPLVRAKQKPVEKPPQTPELPTAKQQMDILFSGLVGNGDEFIDAEQSLARAGWKIRPEAAHRAAVSFFAALPEWIDDIPTSDALRKKWAKGFRDHAQEFSSDELPTLYKAAWSELKQSKLSITWSGAFTTKMIELRKKKRAVRTEPTWFSDEVDPQDLEI